MPNKIRRICVFDTETTDCMPRYPKDMVKPDPKLSEKDKLEQTLSYQPHVLQLSYIIYDLENPKDAKIFNKYIKITPEIGAKIHPDVVQKCRFDFNSLMEKPEEQKISIEEALSEFVNDIKSCDVIVGHNVTFDRKLLLTEVLRLPNPPEVYLDLFTSPDNFTCSMNETAHMCNLRSEVKNKSGNITYRLKPPKLSEAYEYFFGYKPNGDYLHDAIIDIVVCLRLFAKYKLNIDVCGENAKITEYIKLVSPPNYSCEKISDTLPNKSPEQIELDHMNDTFDEPMTKEPKKKLASKRQLNTIYEEIVPVVEPEVQVDNGSRRSTRKRMKITYGSGVTRRKKRKH
jgi:DNA polymerase III subunit epsilon